MTSATTDKGKHVVIIGAGAGGIGLAARLAKAGMRVTVVEKNGHTGGRCSLLYDRVDNGEYRFDQGPSLLLLPKLFREIFHDLDTSIEAEGVELLRCPSNYAIHFSDGELFRQSSDMAEMKTQIERFEGKGGFERYLAWMAEAHRHYEISVEHVLAKNFTSMWNLVAPRFFFAGLKIHPLESIWNRASRYFYSDRLRRVFTFATMYMGMSPYDAPATYSLLQYTEQAEGIWYPRGGFHAILDALVRVGQRLGVQYRLNAPVAKILSGGKNGPKSAAGVLLESGETIPADFVVVNADLVYAYSNLFPETANGTTEKYARSLRQRDASCSSISFYWSMSRKIPELATHNIFLADAYRESFDDIFKRQALPEDPSFYINVPSRVDPTAAPANADAVIALVPVGHLLKSRGYENDDRNLTLEDQDWDALVARARESVLATVQARTGCAPLAPLIKNEIVNTPSTWQERFNLDKGAILGLSHSFMNVLSFRPRTRARGLDNVFFVGASTHPGTGVPIVLAGSKITADQLLSQAGIVAPWRGKEPCVRDKGVPQDAKTPQIDRLSRPWTWEGQVSAVIGLLLAILLLIMYGGQEQRARLTSDW